MRVPGNAHWTASIPAAAAIAFACGLSARAASEPAPAQPAHEAPVAATAAAPEMKPTVLIDLQLQEEIGRLKQMEQELQAIESAPLPAAEPVAPPPKAEKPAPKPDDLPKAPAKGLEEEYANTLYALGECERARAVYRRIVDAKPKTETRAWAKLQIGNCARRTNDLPGAVAAYEDLMNDAPDNPWAKDAAWWASEIKWWMLWNETMKKESGPTLTQAAAK